MIVGQIGAGQTIEELLADFPDLEREDILQALRYAARLAQPPRVTVTERTAACSALPIRCLRGI
jgi:uncharacterized protein (DUF433 family)